MVYGLIIKRTPVVYGLIIKRTPVVYGLIIKRTPVVYGFFIKRTPVVYGLIIKRTPVVYGLIIKRTPVVYGLIIKRTPVVYELIIMRTPVVYGLIIKQLRCRLLLYKPTNRNEAIRKNSHMREDHVGMGYTVDLVIFACLNFREFPIWGPFTNFRIREYSFFFSTAIIKIILA